MELRRHAPPLLAAAAILVLAVAGLWLGSYSRYIVSLWLIFALSAVGLNIPIGLASIYSFGHGAFMLIGAYATGVAMANWGWSFAPALALSIVLAVIAGALVGLPSLRLTGFSLAIVTFAFGFMLFHLIKAIDYTGGPQGIFMPDLGFTKWWGGRFVYYLILALFVAMTLAAYSLMGSRTGRALRTLGANEIVAQSLGVNLLRTRIVAFVLSSVYAAVAGSLMAALTAYVAPETYAPELSINIFAAVMIGGMGTIMGPILGALFIVLVPELTQSAQNAGQIVYSAIFLLVATLFPAGLLGMARSAIARLQPRRTVGA